MQTQDRFLEDLIEFRLSALTFCPWGFHRLEIDREALAGGIVALAACAGILPDGLLFDIPEADTPPSPKPLEGHWEQDRDELNVYLAIPDYRHGSLNVASSQGVRNTRYFSDVLMRRDENTRSSEKPIQVARKNFRLLVEGESLEGCATLAFARVQRSPTGDYQLDPRFVPPVVDIGASEYLMAVARRLVEVLSAKSSALAGTRRQRQLSLAEFGVSDVASFWLLYTVNTYLPHLRHLFETRRGHPGELYEAMLSLAGALTTFSPTFHPRDLPVYDHTDLAGCFTTLDEQLRELLETVVPANYVSLPMRLVEPSVYATAIDQERYLAAEQAYLAVRADLEPGDLAAKVPQLVKVGSGDRIETLIKQALPGVGMTHTAAPPSSIPVKLDYQYFRLTRAGNDWDAITLARNLAAYVPSDLPEPQLELVLVMPPKE
jgi:type VI secretion system protein ImpJ